MSDNQKFFEVLQGLTPGDKLFNEVFSILTDNNGDYSKARALNELLLTKHMTSKLGGKFNIEVNSDIGALDANVDAEEELSYSLKEMRDLCSCKIAIFNESSSLMKYESNDDDKKQQLKDISNCEKDDLDTFVLEIYNQFVKQPFVTKKDCNDFIGAAGSKIKELREEKIESFLKEYYKYNSGLLVSLAKCDENNIPEFIKKIIPIINDYRLNPTVENLSIEYCKGIIDRAKKLRIQSTCTIISNYKVVKPNDASLLVNISNCKENDKDEVLGALLAMEDAAIYDLIPTNLSDSDCNQIIHAAKSRVEELRTSGNQHIIKGLLSNFIGRSVSAEKKVESAYGTAGELLNNAKQGFDLAEAQLRKARWSITGSSIEYREQKDAFSQQIKRIELADKMLKQAQLRVKKHKNEFNEVQYQIEQLLDEQPENVGKIEERNKQLAGLIKQSEDSLKLAEAASKMADFYLEAIESDDKSHWMKAANALIDVVNHNRNGFKSTIVRKGIGEVDFNPEDVTTIESDTVYRGVVLEPGDRIVTTKDVEIEGKKQTIKLEQDYNGTLFLHGTPKLEDNDTPEVKIKKEEAMFIAGIEFVRQYMVNYKEGDDIVLKSGANNKRQAEIIYAIFRYTLEKRSGDEHDSFPPCKIYLDAGGTGAGYFSKNSWRWTRQGSDIFERVKEQRGALEVMRQDVIANREYKLSDFYTPPQENEDIEDIEGYQP